MLAWGLYLASRDSYPIDSHHGAVSLGKATD